MVEEIMPGIYRMEIPIPNSPLKATNAYVIKGEDRNLLVDTGQNTQISLEVLQADLAELAVDMELTDILITHMHADHSGLVHAIKKAGTILYATAPDALSINNFRTDDAPWGRLYDAACRNGFTKEEASMAIKRHPANTAGSNEPLNFTIVAQGTVLTVGDYQLSCIETPGHTKGHICLYEPSRKILFSGDHILGDISPNITHYWGDGNPLHDFMASLQKINELAVELVLPGHRRIFTDCGARISELVEHHRQRADEVVAILADGVMTGYQVAARMTWDMVYRSWDEVAVSQKFFATGEALSHLRYVEAQGLIYRDIGDDNTYYWRLK